MKKRTKKKIKKYFKKHKYLVFLFFVLFLLVFMGTGYSLLKTELYLNGNAKINNSSSSEDEDKSGVCQMSLDFEQRANWGDNYIYKITINNNSSNTINEWVLKFLEKDDITLEEFSGTLYEEGGYYYLASVAWNATIEPNSYQEILIQFSANGDIDKFLNNIIIVACGGMETEEKKIIKQGNASLELKQLEVQLDVKIELKESGLWGSEQNSYTLTITNNTNYTILSWRGMVYFGDKTVNPSSNSINALIITDRTDVSFLFENNGGNGGILPGESIELEMILSTADPDFFPDIVVAGLREI